jgi:hypothetical protein
LAPAAVLIPEPVSAGGGIVVVDGRTTNLVVKSANGNTWQIVGEDFSLDVAPQGMTGRLEGSFTARAGERVLVSGEGFAPESLIAAYLPGASSAALGEARVGPDGIFSVEALIPLTLQPGQYVFQVNGLATASSVRSINLGMQLLPAMTKAKMAKSITVPFIPYTANVTKSGQQALLAWVKRNGKAAGTAVIVSRLATRATAAQVPLALARAKAVRELMRGHELNVPLRFAKGFRRVQNLKLTSGVVVWLRGT